MTTFTKSDGALHRPQPGLPNLSLGKCCDCGRKVQSVDLYYKRGKRFFHDDCDAAARRMHQAKAERRFEQARFEQAIGQTAEPDDHQWSHG